MRLLFIGQAPSRETEGEPPFTGKCGKFLAELMGMTQEEMLEKHDFLNVFEHYQGKDVGGDRFPFPLAKNEAKKLLPKMQDRAVILLGSNVARAFNAVQFRYFETYELRDPRDPKLIVCPRMYIVPHPSGINRWWNRPENRQMARRFFDFFKQQEAVEEKAT